MGDNINEMLGIKNDAGASPASSPALNNGSSQNGGFDFRILANFILVLGCFLACIGGYKYITNLPVSSPQPSMSANTLQAMNSFVTQLGASAGADSENEIRAYNRDGAFKFMGAGAIIIFVGVAVRMSVQKPKSKNAA